MKKTLLWPWISALVVLSFIRENFFLVLNGVINGRGSYKANIRIPEFLYNEFSPTQLSVLKSVAVVVFIASFMVLTILSIDRIFNHPPFRKIAVTVCLSLLGLSVLLFLFNSFLEWPVLYTLFIKTSHLLQSPIPAFILIPVFHFYQKFSTMND